MNAFIAALAERVQNTWREKHFSESEFPRIAKDALIEARAAEHLRTQEIIDWVFAAQALPQQLLPNGTFGNPPVQLFVGERFYIEALFWLDGTTNIHDHSFYGAFTVLEGSSLHTRYTFARERKISSELELGRLLWQTSEVLHQGDVREILGEREMIHALFHLARPSVTLVVRTFRDLLLQFSYLPPGIAHAPQRHLPQTLLQQRLFQLLLSTDARGFAQTAEKYFATCDDASALFTLLDFAAHGIEEEMLSVCLSLIAKRDEQMAVHLAAALQTHIRTMELITWRKRVREPDARFLLALLLNLPNRDTIFAALQNDAPAQHVCRVLKNVAPIKLEASEWLALEAELQNAQPSSMTKEAFTQRIARVKTVRALSPLFR